MMRRGEAYDKVARAIGLGYPGGPKIDRIAKEGNPDAIVFPRAKMEDSPYDFSFSGVKSAVLNYINGCHMKGETFNPADIAAFFPESGGGCSCGKCNESRGRIWNV